MNPSGAGRGVGNKKRGDQLEPGAKSDLSSNTVAGTSPCLSLMVLHC